MHRPILLAMTFLLGVATIAVTAVAATIPRTPIGANATSSNLEIVRQYYDAVNTQIATGDASVRRDLFHPDFRDLSIAEEHGLEAVIDKLHRFAPEVRLVPKALAADGDEVIVQVQADIDHRLGALAFEVDDLSVIWPSFETFRLAEGVIVERNSSLLGLVSLQAVAAMSIGVENFPGRLVKVDHSLYGPGVWRGFTTNGGPALLLVTSGELLVTMPPEIASRARLFHLQPGVNGEPGEERPSGHELALTADTAILIPTGTVFTVRNRGTEVATALESGAIDPSKSYPVNQRLIASGFTAEDASGLIVTPLLNINMYQLQDKNHLSLGLLTLMPGARLPVAATAGPMILLYDQGALHVETVGKPIIRYEGSCDGDMKAPSRSANLPCSVMMAEPSGAVVNVGDTPVTARVLVLERQLATQSE
jgi:hypothetical protein